MGILAWGIVWIVKGVPTVQVETADAIETAIAWQLRLAEADADVWAQFVAWLEASPANAAAYDRIALADRLLAEARFPAPVTLAENDNVPAPRGMRWWIGGGAVAAAAAVALAVAPSMLPRSQPYQVATRDGERQTIALADGTRIELSGGSQVTLDRANPRVASLDGSVAKIVKLEHAWRRLDGRNDDGFQVAPFPG